MIGQESTGKVSDNQPLWKLAFLIFYLLIVKVFCFIPTENKNTFLNLGKALYRIFGVFLQSSRHRHIAQPPRRGFHKTDSSLPDMNVHKPHEIRCIYRYPFLLLVFF